MTLNSHRLLMEDTFTRLVVILLIISLPYSNFAQSIKQADLNALSAKYTKASFPLLRDLLSIPNNAYYPQEIEKNVIWCEQEFSKRGFTTERITTTHAPLLLVNKKGKKSKKTVLIYLQIDGQPIDPTKWFQKDPYSPVLKKLNTDNFWEELPWNEIEEYDDEWRVFARSASDAKGPVAMFLAAMDAINDMKIAPNYNIKVIMDFEEELGSPRLPMAVNKNRELLEADMLVIFDGPRHISNNPTLTFGARGIATITLTTYGPIVPQHSGHYGNYAPNPALRLSQLLASMKDESGRVTIPGFYDGVSIDPATERILRAVPDDEKEIMEKLQIGSIDGVGQYYQESIQYPSLNILGMKSGWIDEETRTIVPDQARAELDIRLVMESNPEQLINLVKDHIVKEGYYITGDVPTRKDRLTHKKVTTFNYKISYKAFRTDFDSEVGIWLRKAMKRAFGKEPVMIRMGGGSIPISPFITALNVPAVIVPTVNSDNNQHSPNENIRLGNYRDGVKTIIAILTEKL